MRTEEKRSENNNPPKAPGQLQNEKQTLAEDMYSFLRRGAHGSAVTVIITHQLKRTRDEKLKGNCKPKTPISELIAEEAREGEEEAGEGVGTT